MRNCCRAGFPYTCSYQHGSRVIKFALSLMCAVRNFWFALSIKKLELWSSTSAARGSVLCYV